MQFDLGMRHTCIVVLRYFSGRLWEASYHDTMLVTESLVRNVHTKLKALRVIALEKKIGGPQPPRDRRASA